MVEGASDRTRWPDQVFDPAARPGPTHAAPISQITRHDHGVDIHVSTGISGYQMLRLLLGALHTPERLELLDAGPHQGGILLRFVAGQAADSRGRQDRPFHPAG